MISPGNCVAMSLYILEQLSSWSTLRIRPSCPRSRVRLNLLPDLLPQVYFCILWPIQYLAVCSNGSHFTLDLFSACWRPSICTQVKQHFSDTSDTYGHTQIYITSTLFSFFLTPLPLPLAGRLLLTDLVGHSKATALLSHQSVNFYLNWKSTEQ